MTTFELNGVSVETEMSHPHLLAAIRDEFGLISPKDGCSPSGQCGCCTVLIDGKARVACQTSMEKIEDTKVLTLELMAALTQESVPKILFLIPSKGFSSTRGTCL